MPDGAPPAGEWRDAAPADERRDDRQVRRISTT